MKRDISREEKADAGRLESTQVSGRPLPIGPGPTGDDVAAPAPLSDLVTNGGPLTQWSVGERLSERFEIRSVAGMGGMGVVYRAHDQELGCDVALKVLREGAEHERFTREARLLSQLDHENIVKYVAEGAAASGQRYLAMEWLDGQDLSTRLQHERLSIRDAVAIAGQVASALAVAHDLGVVHRDINPRNIFLVDGDPGRVKVLDFGVARAPTVTHPLTSAGSPIGTPGYMAPEQAQGQSSVSAAADVFGLGCVLYESLTGRRAFSGQTLMELFARILVDDVRPVRALVAAVPPALDALVMRMLSKSPSNRPQHGREIAEALRSIGPLSDAPVSEPVPPQSEGAITDAEQRLSSIILLTRVSGTEFASLERTASQHGVKPQRLADGSVVVVLGNRGSATDQVAAAARCALDVRSCVTGAVVAVATGRAVTNGHKPMGEAIERASAALLAVDKSELEAGTEATAESKESRVFVDRVTAGLLDARFDIATTKAGLLLVGMRDEGEPIRTVLGRRTRCIGRRRELAFFDSTLEECIEDSVARAVLVTGASGIGKTRLMHEFLRKVRRETPEVAVLSARAEPTSVGSPFVVLGRAISKYAGMPLSGSLEARQAALYACLARSVPPLDLPRIYQFLCELCGVPLPDEHAPVLARARADHVLMGDQMRRAFEDWLGAECRKRPVLLVLDDFHWGDLPTVHFIDALLRNSSEDPLMVLALAQPEVHQQFPELWSRRGVFQLRLTGLSRRASERLAREILGENAEPAVVERVVERAHGNPFWLEELVRVEAESGQVPDAVVLMAQARLERLNHEARLVLRAASILGRRFWDGGVLALLGPKLSSVALARVLANLEEREIVAALPNSRFRQQRELEFSSSLLRDAAYGSLTPADLERGHLAAGHWLEAMGEQDAVALAEHFSKGGAAERATHWYLQGAEQALRGNDWTAARQRASEGRAAAATGDQTARLLAVEAEACKWSGDNGRALQCSLDILQSLPTGDPTWCRAAGEAIAAAGKLSQAGVYRELGNSLLCIEPAPANEPALITALGRSATQLVLCGEVELGRLLLERADALASSVHPDSEVLAWVLEARAVTAGAMDNASERVELAAAAAESFEKAGDLRNACLQRISVGYACVEIGAYERAERALSDGLEVAQRMGLSNSIPIAQAQLGRALETFGKFDQARGLLHEAIEALDKHANTRLAGVVRCYLAQALLRQGNVAEAERVAREAVDVLEGVPPMRPTALATLALVRLAQDEARAALELTVRANEGLGPETRLNFGEALVRLSHGLALTATGRHADAKHAFGAARERLLRRAELISDPKLKELFLTAVLENRTTLELASDEDAR